jgi:hypothetical protein
MTTRLFSILDDMKAAGLTVPELVDRIDVERVLPFDIGALPAVCIQPRLTDPSALGGEVQGRDGKVLVIVRTAGNSGPGRAAHELLAKLHQALMRYPNLNNGSVQLELGTESFRYIDSEESVCDLQAEYGIAFEHDRDSLL